MKTTIEVHGYEIKIDEMNEKIMVSAVRDGETVEEFELDVDAQFGDDDSDMSAFGEEEDFEEMGDDDMEDMEDMDDEEMEEDDMDDDDMEDEMDEEEEKKLESFSHFVKRRK